MIKKNLKLILIVIGVTILVELLIVIIAAEIDNYKYSHSDDKVTDADKYYYDNRDKVNLEMGKYVESKDYLLSDGNILVEVINRNDFAGTGKIYIEFFDENNESITMQDNYFSYVGSGKKTYVEINVSDELKKLYKTYKVKVVLTYNSSHNDYYGEDKIKVVSFNEATGSITLKNNTNKKLESIKWGLLYYDENGKIINYSDDYTFDVKKNKTVKERTYLKEGKYSKIEVVILEAYN